MSIPRSSVLAGARSALPLALPVLPVGLVLGLIINDTDRVSAIAGWASGPIVLGGAAQLAGISLLATGAGAVPAALTIAVVNARHVMYSARLRPWFAGLPLWFRIVGPYFLLDQLFALTELAAAEDTDATDGERMGRYLGGGAVLAGCWWVALAVGLIAGGALPEGWSLDFSVPLLFLGLLVLSVSNLPGVLAAVAGGTVAVIGSGFPNGSGLLAGAVVGVAVGGLADWWLERRAGSSTPEVEPDGVR